MNTPVSNLFVRADEQVEIVRQDEPAELVDLGTITTGTHGTPIPGKVDTGVGFQPI